MLEILTGKGFSWQITMMNLIFFFFFALYLLMFSAQWGGSYTAATNRAQLILAKKVSAWNYNAFLVIILTEHGSL